MSVARKTGLKPGVKSPRKGRWSDWIGAQVLAPGQDHKENLGQHLFYVFRASSDPDRFAIAGEEHPVLPPCPDDGTWELFKVLPESGKRRVGFSEADAKYDIAMHGYHLVEIGSGAEPACAGSATGVRRRAKGA